MLLKIKNTSPQVSHPKYRPDIDGLRTLAVLPVVIFHAFPESLRGGYTGVDVFFVISGFLISSIIFSNIEAGTFSFFEFYSRRIRRIFPTLLTVLLSCIVVGYFLLLPVEYKQLGKHIAGSSIFVSNFVLLSESGYFDTSSISKPLLHLWSLGIEEQFYIVWPLLLVFIHKRNINLFAATLTFLALSFILNCIIMTTDPSQGFYSPITRFWEILAGTSLAWITLYKRDFFNKIKWSINKTLLSVIRAETHNFDIVAHTTSITGVLMLFVGYCLYTESLAFPGVYALLPVCGAFLLIMSGPDAIINKYILSSRVFIWVGLISFPLYLWHWPLLSFSYIIENGSASPLIRGALVLSAIGLSVLSYLLIENKLRFGGNLTGKTLLLFISMAIVGIAGLAIYFTNGISGRFTQTRAEINDDRNIEKLITESQKRCANIFPEWSKYTDNLCVMQKPSGKNKIAIIGDSHANHLFIGMSELKGNDGVAVFPASCAAPFIDVSSSTKDPKALAVRKNAYKLINSAYDYVIKDNNIHEVILAHNPSCSYNDSIDIENTSITDTSIIIESGMRRSIEKLVSAGKKVVIVKDNPELPFIPQNCTPRPINIFHNNNKCSFDKSIYSNNIAHSTYNDITDNVIKDYPNVSSVNLSSVLCDNEKCYLSKNGHVLYSDIGHLNKYGSRYVAPIIAEK